MEKSLRIVWVDLFRVMAIVQIVGYHMLYLIRGGISAAWCGLLGMMLESGVLSFVFISGYLFQRRHGGARPFVFFEYLRGRLFHVLLPYFIASILLTILHGWKTGAAPAEWLRELPATLLWGRAAAPFWFVPMILGFYLLAPVWRWVDRRGGYVYLAPLLLLPFVLSRGGYTELWRNSFYFLPYYLAGMAAARGVLPSRPGRVAALTGICAVPLLLTVWRNPGFAFLQDAGKLFIAMELCLCALAMERAVARHGGIARLLTAIAGAGMGIYLYHNSVVGTVFAPIWRCCSGAVGAWGALTFLCVGALLCVLGMTGALVLMRMILRKLGLRDGSWLFGA